MIRHAVVAFFLSFSAAFIMIFLYVILPTILINTFSPKKLPAFLVQTLPLPLASATPSPTPVPTPGLIPVTLIIPKLDIQAAIEQVGLTPTNNMDVPKNAANAAWYLYGPKPSELGNSVIAGHYDTPAGKPALFFQLKKLEVGDTVEVVSENAVRSTFVVVEKATIPYDQFPSDHVFKTRAGKNLNLITCGGIWDPKKKTYLERIVVYTTLKEPIGGGT